MTTAESKRIRALRKSFKAERQRITEAMAQCQIGTAVYLSHVKQLADSEARERAEEIALGLVPANLGAAQRTEFLYVSFVSHCPTNREEMQAILDSQAVKSCKGLRYSPEDESIREQLQKEFQ